MSAVPGQGRLDLDDAAIVRDYLAGVSIEDLARKYYASTWTIRARLREARVTFRTQSEAVQLSFTTKPVATRNRARARRPQ